MPRFRRTQRGRHYLKRRTLPFPFSFPLAQGGRFDGSSTTVWRTADLTGNADGKLWSGSFWFRRDATGASTYRIYSNVDSRINVRLPPDNTLEFIGQNPSSSTILSLKTSAISDTTRWHHVMWSFDMSDAGKRHVYVDGVLDIASVTTYTDDNLKFTSTDHAIGRVPNSSGFYSGEITEFWMAYAYIDLSQESNRRKFLSPALGPVRLGTSGELPTGSSPIIYIKNPSSGANFGTGGDFVVSIAPQEARNLPGILSETQVVVVSSDVTVVLTAIASTTALGSFSVLGDANTSIVGNTATGAVGTITVSGSAIVTLTGVGGAGALGSFAVTGEAVISIPAASSPTAVGSITVQGDANVSLAGVFGVSGIGTITVSGSAVITLPGVAATGAVGTIVVQTDGAITVLLIGVSSTAAANVPSVQGAANVPLVGVPATGTAGVFVVSAGATVSLSGVSATGQVGTITVVVDSGGNVTVALSGAVTTGQLGALSIVGGANTALQGVSSASGVGVIIIGEDAQSSRIIRVALDARGLVVDVEERRLTPAADSRVVVIRSDDDTVH